MLLLRFLAWNLLPQYKPKISIQNFVICIVSFSCQKHFFEYQVFLFLLSETARTRQKATKYSILIFSLLNLADCSFCVNQFLAYSSSLQDTFYAVLSADTNLTKKCTMICSKSLTLFFSWNTVLLCSNFSVRDNFRKGLLWTQNSNSILSVITNLRIL